MFSQHNNWNWPVRRLPLIASWGLFAAIVIQWSLIRWLGDGWWPGTVLLFAPRWLLLIPLAVVTIACLAYRRKLLWVNAITALLLFGPVLGFCLSLRFDQLGARDFQLRVLTANTGGGATLELLRRIIQTESPDVITFQEYDRFPPDQLVGAGWQWKIANGPAIFSRYPILVSETFPADRVGRYGDVGLRVQIETLAGKIWLCSQHLNTPREGFEELALTRHGLTGTEAIERLTAEREFESQTLHAWAQELTGPTVIAGDFNMPVESRIYRRNWSDYQNAFSIAGWGYGHTKFTRWHGVRIDHILADDHWRVTACHVAGFTGGDHRPVVADIGLLSK